MIARRSKSMGNELFHYKKCYAKAKTDFFWLNEESHDDEVGPNEDGHSLRFINPCMEELWDRLQQEKGLAKPTQDKTEELQEESFDILEESG